MPEKKAPIKTNRVINFHESLEKLAKPKFKEWFEKRYKDEKDWEAHYEKLHAPAKEETK